MLAAVIRPCAHIHDAQYYLIPDDMDVLRYVNEHLVREVEWQDHPAIRHDEVKLGGALSIFFPDWSAECVFPNGATVDEIAEMMKNHQDRYCDE